MEEVRQKLITAGHMKRNISSPRPKPKAIKVSRDQMYSWYVRAFPRDAGFSALAIVSWLYLDNNEDKTEKLLRQNQTRKKCAMYLGVRPRTSRPA